MTPQALYAAYEAHCLSCPDCHVTLPCPAGVKLRAAYAASVAIRDKGKVTKVYEGK